LPACPLWSNSQQRRNLNVHEHVSYSLLKGAGIPVPKFGVAKTGKEAAELVRSLGLTDIAVKAQVLAGGRGLGHFKKGFKGGVKMVDTLVTIILNDNNIDVYVHNTIFMNLGQKKQNLYQIRC